MIETLKKRSNIASLRMACLCFLIAAVCLVYSCPGILNLIKGPVEIGADTNYSELKGSYVTYYVELPIDYYMESTSTDSDTNITETTALSYFVYNYQADNFFGVKIKTDDENKYSSLIDATQEYLFNDADSLPEGFTVTGTLEELTGDALDYYNETAAYYLNDDYISAAFPYYINDDTICGKDIIMTELLFLLACLFLIGGFVGLFHMFSGSFLKKINQYLCQNTNLSIADIEADFLCAQNINKSLWVGKRWLIWMKGYKANILPTDTLVWAYYYYRNTGKQRVSEIITYDINKKRHLIPMSKKSANEVLDNWSRNQPHIQLGYDKATKKQFSKDFEGFLNQKYNTAKANERFNETYESAFVSNDGFTVKYNDPYATTSESDQKQDSTSKL